MSKLALEIKAAIHAHRLPSLEGVLPQDEFILPRFKIDHKAVLKPACVHRDLGLEVRPPDVVRCAPLERSRST